MGIEASPPVRSDEPRPSMGRPAAAAAGLPAAATALALVVVGLLNSPLRPGLTLIALCVALMAAWTALSPLPSTAPGTCPPSSRPRPPGASAASPATAADRHSTRPCRGRPSGTVTYLRQLLATAVLSPVMGEAARDEGREAGAG
jgi:hypothetical protein